MDGSTAHIDVTSIPGYAISVNAITENQVKHTDGLDLSQPYIRNAREIANSQYDTPLCTLSSFASAPADFSQPATRSNDSSFLPLFPLSQSYSMSTSLTNSYSWICSKWTAYTADPAYFHPTGILRSHAPSRRKRSTKKVNQHVKPVPTTLPEEFRIYPRDYWRPPLADIPILSTHPPDFHPTGRYTQENHDLIEENHPGDFLWPDERKLMHHFMMLQESGFAWDESAEGEIQRRFLSPVTIPVIEHIPWVHKNIHIPPGLYHEVIEIVKDKIASGIYEPSSSSYHSK